MEEKIKENKKSIKNITTKDYGKTALFGLLLGSFLSLP